MENIKTKTNKISIILGRKGCGKTTLIKQLIKKESRVIIYDVLGEFEQEAVLVTDLDALSGYIKAKSFKLRFVGDDIDFESICQFIYDIGNCLFVVDEVDWLCSPVSIPESFAKLIRYGRHRQIDLICASRRPADVPRLITSQADYLYLFSILEPRDLAYLDEFIGHLNIREKISSVKKFSYISYDVAEDKLSQSVTKI